MICFKRVEKNSCYLCRMRIRALLLSHNAIFRKWKNSLETEYFHSCTMFTLGCKHGRDFKGKFWSKIVKINEIKMKIKISFHPILFSKGNI
jgi:hypothetical protein